MSNQILTRDSCTALKALSILMVITHHLYVPIIGRYFGFTACALFFLISGYGLTKSMDNHEWDYNHLKNSVLKLLKPYLFFWLISISVLLIVKGLSSENLISFLTLGFPNLTGWFYRTIIAIYIINFFTRRIVRRYYMEVMFILALLYVLFVHDKLDFFWWNSIICFPLGILVAKHQELIVRHKNIIMLCSLLVYGFCVSQIGILCDDVYTIMGGGKLVNPLSDTI